MNILITGSQGFVGTYLSEGLSSAGNNVIKVNWPRGSDKDGYCTDFMDKDQVNGLARKLRNKKIDVIIHLAASMCHSANMKDLSLLFENTTITLNTISLALKLRPKKFVHASSVAVYPPNGMFNEESRVDMSSNSDCLYGLAKFNAEVLFDLYLKGNMAVVHLRLAQIFGPGMRQDRIIPSLIKELKENNMMTLYAKGRRITNFVHINDVVKVFNKVIKSDVKGVFNVAHEKNYTLNELAKIIAKAQGKPKAKIIKIDKGTVIKQYIKSEKLKKKLKIVNRELNFYNIAD